MLPKLGAAVVYFLESLNFHQTVALVIAVLAVMLFAWTVALFGRYRQLIRLRYQPYRSRDEAGRAQWSSEAEPERSEEEASRRRAKEEARQSRGEAKLIEVRLQIILILVFIFSGIALTFFGMGASAPEIEKHDISKLLVELRELIRVSAGNAEDHKAIVAAITRISGYPIGPIEIVNAQPSSGFFNAAFVVILVISFLVVPIYLIIVSGLRPFSRQTVAGIAASMVLGTVTLGGLSLIKIANFEFSLFSSRTKDGPPNVIRVRYPPEGECGRCVAGLPGPPGPPGARGDPGPKGDQGPVGDRGPIGDRGPGGERGPVGERGLVGDRGPPGDRGADGKSKTASCKPPKKVFRPRKGPRACPPFNGGPLHVHPREAVPSGEYR